MLRKHIVAITGASGVIYGIRLVEELLKREIEVHLVASRAACLVLEEELGWDLSGGAETAFSRYFSVGRLKFYENDNLAVAIASGSFMNDGMVVIPCSMGTLSGIAHGSSSNLLERAADVTLKEKRPLILVPRETPLNSIHLRNMLTLSEMGAHIIPPMPGFYHHPQSLDDIISFVVGKVLDAMGIEHQLYKRYE
ncbi:MAG: UbiX family flavin prenyltransferase [Syntrophomonadaceae bacterium]|nr:UbiX family flavin prenyltransferase [Syntrophomonadaceae bacterium]